MRRHHATADQRVLEMVTRTLDAMMRGGIYDQLGGGFHRYSTDEMWLVPHFEKMLYDNAQLARLYLHAWQVTSDEAYRRVATETLDYLAREMLDPAGGFYSSQDADSEGGEGRFFVWTPTQIRAALGGASDDPDRDADLFNSAYGVSDRGNFEGANILFVARAGAEIAAERGLRSADVEVRLADTRRVLLAARASRVKPGVDDKVLCGWNGLALAAFAEAARVLDRDDYLAIAERNADFVLANMRSERGRMLRTWKGGRAGLNGYLEDYAHVADGLLELYRTTFDPRWFAAARELADSILEHFVDSAGGFFDTSDDHEALIVRPKGLEDGAVPSGGAMAAGVLLRLAHLTGEGRYADAGEAALRSAQPMMVRTPLGVAHWLAGLDFALAPVREIAVVGDGAESLVAVLQTGYRPNVVVAARGAEESGGDVSAIALLDGRVAVGGRATAYVCERQTCGLPVTTRSKLEAILGK